LSIYIIITNRTHPFPLIDRAYTAPLKGSQDVLHYTNNLLHYITELVAIVNQNVTCVTRLWPKD